MSRQVTGIVKTLCMSLYIGAARSAAIGDTSKFMRLREALLPALDRYRAREIDESDVLDIVDQVMGDWEVPEDWRNQLDALGFTRGIAG